jgi:DNA polymerase I-like protein with 3'-5' exonuclease and polymerase domains
MYLVFDSETETNIFHGRKASPFSPDNWVVMRGWKKQGWSRAQYSYHPTLDRTTYLKIDDDVTMLVGFNIKFDLLHEMAQRSPDVIPFFKRGGTVWDCQYAEYLLMAQQDQAQMTSLDAIVESYGGRKKIDIIKTMWEAGVKTSEIQEQLLLDYLVGTEEEGRNSGDVGNTELIMKAQIKRAHELGMLTAIQDRMDGLVSTTFMEFAGLKVDIAEASRRLGELEAEMQAVVADLSAYLPDDLPEELEWNWGSGTHASCIVYGGTVRYQKKAPYYDESGDVARKKAYEDWPMIDGEPWPPNTLAADLNGREFDKYLSGKKRGEIKTRKVEVLGEVKTRYTDFFYEFPRITEPRPEWKLAQTDGRGNPLWSTAKDQIAELSLRNIPFLKSMASKGRLDKEIGTYYLKTDKSGKVKGLLTAVQISDHVVHHNLNHSLTVTTRLSSSNPSLQHVPKAGVSQVKRMFVSRFKNGLMGEIDYSQLEVVVQGMLSGDPALMKDLRDKIDFHCKRVSAKHGITYEEAVDWCKNDQHPDFKAGKAARNAIKQFSFQRAYGAGAAAIAYETDIPIADVEQMIVNEDLMYPGVVKFNSEVEMTVKKSAVPFQAMDADGRWKTYRRGFWQAPTGTMYSWRTYDAPSWLQKRGITDSFMPTEIKNYPVQGTGGEVVQLVLGRLIRLFIDKDFYGQRAFLCNTVHDCVWVDMHPDVVDEVISDMLPIMQSIPELLAERHGMVVDVPFPVEAEVGPNMYDLKHWHPLNVDPS